MNYIKIISRNNINLKNRTKIDTDELVENTKMIN